MEHIRPLHSYRTTLWPEGVAAADIEEAAAKGALPTLQLRAACADAAAALALHVSGLRVVSVVRVEPCAAAALVNTKEAANAGEYSGTSY